MEILGHFYAFGNPRTQIVVDPPKPPRTSEVEALRLLSKEDRLTLAELNRKVIAAQARLESQRGSTPNGSPPKTTTTQGGDK